MLERVSEALRRGSFGRKAGTQQSIQEDVENLALGPFWGESIRRSERLDRLAPMAGA